MGVRKKLSTLVLIRHGTTSWNQKKVYQGHNDIPLAPLGLKQAEYLRQRFKNVPVKAFYASDLKRASETAKIIASIHQKEVITLPELKEINFGEWEGLSFTEISQRYNGILEQWIKNPGEVKIPGGESYNDVKERASDAIHKIASENEGTVVIVSHGGVISAFFCAVFRLSLTAIWKLRLDNASVTIFDYIDNNYILKLYNDTHHLEEIN